MIAAVTATLAIAGLLLTIERRILGRRRLTAAHLDGYVQGVEVCVRRGSRPTCARTGATDMTNSAENGARA